MRWQSWARTSSYDGSRASSWASSRARAEGGMEARDDSGPRGREASRGLRYRRVLLKLSGEALMGEAPYGIDNRVLESIAGEIREVGQLGLELALVIGGGNIFRGVRGATEGTDRATGDYMGMLATVINALALQDAL